MLHTLRPVIQKRYGGVGSGTDQQYDKDIAG